MAAGSFSTLKHSASGLGMDALQRQSEKRARSPWAGVQSKVMSAFRQTEIRGRAPAPSGDGVAPNRSQRAQSVSAAASRRAASSAARGRLAGVATRSQSAASAQRSRLQAARAKPQAHPSAQERPQHRNPVSRPPASRARATSGRAAPGELAARAARRAASAPGKRRSDSRQEASRTRNISSRPSMGAARRRSAGDSDRAAGRRVPGVQLPEASTPARSSGPQSASRSRPESVASSGAVSDFRPPSRAESAPHPARGALGATVQPSARRSHRTRHTEAELADSLSFARLVASRAGAATGQLRDALGRMRHTTDALQQALDDGASLAGRARALLLRLGPQARGSRALLPASVAATAARVSRLAKAAEDAAAEGSHGDSLGGARAVAVLSAAQAAAQAASRTEAAALLQLALAAEEMCDGGPLTADLVLRAAKDSEAAVARDVRSAADQARLGSTALGARLPSSASPDSVARSSAGTRMGRRPDLWTPARRPHSGSSSRSAPASASGPRKADILHRSYGLTQQLVEAAASQPPPPPPPPSSPPGTPPLEDQLKRQRHRHQLQLEPLQLEPLQQPEPLHPNQRSQQHQQQQPRRRPGSSASEGKRQPRPVPIRVPGRPSSTQGQQRRRAEPQPGRDARRGRAVSVGPTAAKRTPARPSEAEGTSLAGRARLDLPLPAPSSEQRPSTTIAAAAQARPSSRSGLRMRASKAMAGGRDHDERGASPSARARSAPRGARTASTQPVSPTMPAAASMTPAPGPAASALPARSQSAGAAGRGRPDAAMLALARSSVDRTHPAGSILSPDGSEGSIAQALSRTLGTAIDSSPLTKPGTSVLGRGQRDPQQEPLDARSLGRARAQRARAASISSSEDLSELDNGAAGAEHGAGGSRRDGGRRQTTTPPLASPGDGLGEDLAPPAEGVFSFPEREVDTAAATHRSEILAPPPPPPGLALAHTADAPIADTDAVAPRRMRGASAAAQQAALDKDMREAAVAASKRSGYGLAREVVVGSSLQSRQPATVRHTALSAVPSPVQDPSRLPTGKVPAPLRSSPSPPRTFSGASGGSAPAAAGPTLSGGKSAGLAPKRPAPSRPARSAGKREAVALDRGGQATTSVQSRSSLPPSLRTLMGRRAPNGRA